MDHGHQSTHMPTVIALAFLVLAIVGQAVAFAYVFGQLHQQVDANTKLSLENQTQISKINEHTNAKLDSLSSQIRQSSLSRHYDEILLQEIAKKVGVPGVTMGGGDNGGG